MITQLPSGEDLIHDVLDPDLEAALRAWWLAAAYGSAANDGECPCCCWYPSDEELEEDPYLRASLAQEYRVEAAQQKKARASEEAAGAWFWTLLHERTGWLPQYGANQLHAQLKQERAHGWLRYA